MATGAVPVAAVDNVSKTTPPGPGLVTVIDGEFDVPVVIAGTGPIPATPENAIAPHTPPAAPDMLTVTVALVLGVKVEKEYSETAGSVVFEDIGVVFVVAPVIVTLLNVFKFEAERLTRIKLGLPTLVLKPVIVQVLPDEAVPVAWAVTAIFARAEFGKIATSAEASRNTPAP